MKLAFTISSYRLIPFIELGLAQIKKLSPESPILVSDDKSDESGHVKNVAEQHGALYIGSRVKRGHFAGDVWSIINSIAFAEANECDVAIKLSQRLILRKPEAIDVIRKTFEDPNIMMATPGRPQKVVTSGGPAAQGFKAFAILTDIVLFRVGAVDPKDMEEKYRHKCTHEHLPWSTFIECFIDDFHGKHLAGKTAKLPEFTDPQPDPIYLRRYQAVPQQYSELAKEHGLSGNFLTGEWSGLENKNYLCKPLTV